MNAFETNIKMIKTVASALGSELLSKVAFVGGCTTSLYIDDEITKESIRYTNDVDLIIHVLGYPDWYKFQQALRDKGFKECIEDGILCRMVLKDLKVDFMPDDENILGFSNKWYKEAYQKATMLSKSHTCILLSTDGFWCDLNSKFQQELVEDCNKIISISNDDDVSCLLIKHISKFQLTKIPEDTKNIYLRSVVY